MLANRVYIKSSLPAHKSHAKISQVIGQDEGFASAQRIQNGNDMFRMENQVRVKAEQSATTRSARAEIAFNCATYRLDLSRCK